MSIGEEALPARVPEVAFVPEYHEGMTGAYFYALPARRGGTSALTNRRLGERCWAVYREALCLNAIGPFDTYEEADGEAAVLAMEEMIACSEAARAGRREQSAVAYFHAPGHIPGALTPEEV